MTTAELLKKESDEILQRKGVYIPPYRLAMLMKMAQKITDIMVQGNALISYHESILILRIVMNAIKETTGEE